MGKMIEETSILLVTLCTSMLLVAFTYYAAKYRRYIKEASEAKIS